MTRPLRRSSAPPPLFYRSELIKLITLVLFMGVLIAAIGRARDPRTWTWFTGEADSSTDGGLAGLPSPDSAPAAPGSQPPRDERLDTASDAPRVDGQLPELPSQPGADSAALAALAIETGPPDVDAAQRAALAYELQAVDDRTELAASEMHAYWRLLAWAAAQPPAVLLERARGGLSFTQIFTEPDRYRGQLIRLKLRFRQAFRWKSPDATLEGYAPEQIYDVRGWNDESQPYHYWLVCPDLPRGFPLGERIQSEGQFAGYFLKLIKYEDHEGKTRAAPLLIGRIAAVQPLAPTSAPSSSDVWIWLIGGGVAVLFGWKWMLPWLWPTPRPRRPRLEINARGEEAIPLEDWLAQAETDTVGLPDAADPPRGERDRHGD